jgi:hypothetical protein
LKRKAQGRWQVRRRAKVGLQMSCDLAGRTERGQDIDEPKELRFKQVILHRPIHQMMKQALLAKQTRLSRSFDPSEDLIPPPVNGRLKIRFDAGLVHDDRWQ